MTQFTLSTDVSALPFEKMMLFGQAMATLESLAKENFLRLRVDIPVTSLQEDPVVMAARSKLAAEVSKENVGRTAATAEQIKSQLKMPKTPFVRNSSLVLKSRIIQMLIDRASSNAALWRRTTSGLALDLNLTDSAVRHCLIELEAEGRVQRQGKLRQKGPGRNPIIWKSDFG